MNEDFGRFIGMLDNLRIYSSVKDWLKKPKYLPLSSSLI
jgi:hypothetical protein